MRRSQLIFTHGFPAHVPLPYPVIATAWDRDGYLACVLGEIRSTGKFVSGCDYWGNDWHNGRDTAWQSYTCDWRHRHDVSEATLEQRAWEAERRELRRLIQKQRDEEWAAAEAAETELKAKEEAETEERVRVGIWLREAEAESRRIAEIKRLAEPVIPDELVPYEPYIPEDGRC